MEFKQLNEHCYYFHGAVNIGYVNRGSEGLLIDAGIDKSAMKKILKQLAAKGLPVTHLFITHAHADHYGGAAFLQESKDVYTMAPVFEAAILRNPKLEPLYLFGGNDPLPELRNKFLEGTAIRVDEELVEGTITSGSFQFDTFYFPGHSYNQLGILVENILYAGDLYFGEKQLYKHKIPYITDVTKTLKSLDKAREIDCEGAVPGHGEFEEKFKKTLKINSDYHEEILDKLLEIIKKNPEGITHEAVVADLCSMYEINAPKLPQWLLFRTAVTAYLIGLINQERIINSIDQYCWTFKVKES